MTSADTWVATDGAGRTMPTSAEAPLKTDKPRTVGIFYITWHTQGLHNGQPYKADVSRVLDEDPGATRNADSPAWTIGSYHWGEPEYGYFLSRDEYVIRHDMSMLADAGVDVIILDVTNAVLYWDEWEVLFRTMQQMKSEGNRVPQFCFWAFNGNVIDVVQSLYDHFYRTPRYEDLWFYWQGKPLLLYNATPTVDANPGGGQHDGELLTEAVRREVMEETGLTVEPMRMSAIFERVSEGREGPAAHKMYFVFLCRYLADVPQQEPVERDAYQTGMEWLPIDRVMTANLFPRVIRDNLPNLIDYGETIYLGSERRGEK